MNPLVPLLVLLALAAPARAAAPLAAGPADRSEGAFHAGEARVEARLLVHPDVDDPRRRELGVLFEIDPGWHLYWRNPGESGLAPELTWEIEGEPSLGEIAWPVPAPFAELDGEIRTYGYEGRVLLSAEATWPAPFHERRDVRVVAEVLVCEHECIPGRFELEGAVPALSSEGSAVAPAAKTAELRRLFADAAARRPRDAAEAGLALAASLLEEGGGGIRASLAVDPCPAGAPCDPLTFPDQTPVFIPDERSGLAVETAEPRLARDGSLVVDLFGPASDAPRPLRLSGVLTLRGPDGPRPVQVDLPLSPASGVASLSLPLALALGLMGGLLLNLMPCVLPVLALKVFALVETASHDRRSGRHHAAAYALGIEFSMTVLALLVVGLRGAGTSLGWGFQLQEPLFVACVAVVLVVFATNLFGAFEIGAGTGRLASLGAQATGARRSFFEGLLAVVLATPCSAPFLGTAVGFAFAAPPAGIVSIFLAIGAGLAAPFVLVSWAPAWSRWIPRSGTWMLKLRTGLGFALLGTVVWLVWIFARTSGADGSAALLGLLLAVAFACWLFGLAQSGGRPRLAAWLATALAGLALAGVGLLRVGDPQAEAAEVGAGAWRRYSRAAVESALASGQPAFVAFSADWCITCKVNERLVLADDRVEAELDRRGYARFKADWTLRDEVIRAELARFGKAGVPLYLVYDPAAPDEPTLLPELLTTDRVMRALGERAAS